MKETTLKPLWRILYQFREYYPIIFIYSVGISILTLATPISVQSLVSSFSFGPYFQPIFILSLILLGLLTLLGLMQSLQYLMVEFLQRKLYARVTASIGRAYFMNDEKEWSNIDDKYNRYFDVILIHKNLAFLVTDGIAMALQTCIGLLLISLYHPFFILFSLLILLAIILPVFLLSKMALETADDESSIKYEVANHIKSLASHEKKKQSYKVKHSETDGYIESFLQKRSQHFKILFIQNIFYVGMYALLNALLLGLGGYLVISNQLSIGQLVAAEIVVNAILSHFLYAKKYLEAFYDMFAASKKVHVFYEYIDKNKAKLSHEAKDQSPLFARNNMEYQQSFKSVLSVYSPTKYKKIFLKFVLASFVFTFILLIVPWQQFSRGYGKVIALDPNDRIQTVTSTVDGVVEEWLVQDGQFVKKGESIVRVVDNDPDYLLRLETSRDAAIAKFDAAKEASDTGRLNFHRQKKLYTEGLTSAKELEKAKIVYKKLRAEEAAAAAILAKAEVDFSRQQQQVIKAPRDGKILRVFLGSGTTNVKAGDPLVEFVPNTDNNAVELYINGNDLPLIFPGRKVRLQFEGWPAIQFSGWPSVAIGSFGGLVTVVDPSVGEMGTFRVLVRPDPDDPVPWPNKNILRQGSRVIGIVILDEVTVGYELWRQVNGFPKSMPHIPETINPEVEK